MRMYDLIEKKKQGRSLTGQELDWMIAGFTEGAIPDYQMAAFLMAVCFQGMSEQETTAMTLAMSRSGEIADLSAIPGIKVDKHSTGGVGDKTTLIAAPMAAACGIPIAKMSGRGLGFTGGTVDKLESIPGYRTALPEEEFFDIVNEVGISLIGQSGELAVADKKIYALRDVTATVDSLPLIASSIMSKKIAAGADAILLDVKTGSGAFMKTEQDALALAQTMVDIGAGAGKRTAALITDMNQPLGRTAGNAIEVAEAVETLARERSGRFDRAVHPTGGQHALAGGQRGAPRLPCNGEGNPRRRQCLPKAARDGAAPGRGRRLSGPPRKTALCPSLCGAGGAGRLCRRHADRGDRRGGGHAGRGPRKEGGQGGPGGGHPLCQKDRGAGPARGDACFPLHQPPRPGGAGEQALSGCGCASPPRRRRSAG